MEIHSIYGSMPALARRPKQAEHDVDCGVLAVARDEGELVGFVVDEGDVASGET